MIKSTTANAIDEIDLREDGRMKTVISMNRSRTEYTVEFEISVLSMLLLNNTRQPFV